MENQNNSSEGLLFLDVVPFDIFWWYPDIPLRVYKECSGYVNQVSEKSMLSEPVSYYSSTLLESRIRDLTRAGMIDHVVIGNNRGQELQKQEQYLNIYGKIIQLLSGIDIAPAMRLPTKN